MKSQITKMFLLAVSLSLPYAMTGCSSSNGDEPDNSDWASPYWVLGTGNSNMPNSGTVISQYSDSPSAYGIANLVDGNVDTKFLTPHASFDITWNGNSNVAVKSYSLTSAADAGASDPASWTFFGSKDGKKWVAIDKQSEQLFAARKETKTYSVDNNVEYRYYKLSVTDNGGGSSTQLSELVLSAASFSGDIDDLMKNSSGKTFSAITPMGTMHENDLTATTAQLSWLKDASKQPDTFENLTWKSFPVGSLYPFGTPRPADVNQHVVGDCCACAVMASIAYLFPNYIKAIVKDNADNTFAVTLYDPSGSPVEIGVDNTFVADGNKVGAASGKNDQVTWATVIEKAIIKWHQVYKGTSNIGGIGTEFVSAILTGSGDSFAFSSGTLSAEELQRAAVVSLNQRKIIVGGFTKGGVNADGTKQTTSGHAFSIFPPKSSGYLFTMRNPWGVLPTEGGGYSTADKDDGCLNISNDGEIPQLIDFRICNPGAAKGYALTGNLEPYNPPAYSVSPMRVSRAILQGIR